MPYGSSYPVNLNKVWRERLWSPGAEALVGIVGTRMVAVRKCLLVDAGRASLTLVTGKDALHTMMTLGVGPQPQALPDQSQTEPQPQGPWSEPQPAPGSDHGGGPWGPARN